jgi:ribosomal peptide maturation radical SAM protein 1
MPSIGLSLLAAVARRHGHSAEILYPGFSLANSIGTRLYKSLSVGYPTNTALAGEFLFSAAYFDKQRHQIDAFISSYLAAPLDGQAAGLAADDFHERFEQDYSAAFARIPEWIETTAAAIVAKAPGVVGFTTMFQQTFASLALARAIRTQLPSCVIVLGGPNVEDPMGQELLLGFPFIDCVCSGEGEDAFVDLLDCKDSGLGHTHRNWRNRATQNPVSVPTSTGLTKLAELPTPCYDDFFLQTKELRDASGMEYRVLLETSRGCWWGAKSHCTFCGLNGSTMTFRAKSADQAFAEIKVLQERYPNTPISVVDNILDYRYFDTLLPLLATLDPPPDLFFETKANISKSQLGAMRRAGITRIQPGIESLSTSVLKLMKKGVSAAQNVLLLRACLEEGIHPEWNFLWGFPGEDESEYERMASLAPALYHLPAPNSSSNLRLDRYSPLYERSSTQSVSRVRPYPAYFEVYDERDVAIDNVAYYFQFDYCDGQQPNAYTAPLAEKCRVWRKRWREAFLFYFAVEGRVVVADGRSPETPRVMRFPAIAARILEYCEQPRGRRQLTQTMASWGIVESHEVLESLLEHCIAIEIDDSIVTLASDLFDSACMEGKVASFLAAIRDSDADTDQEYVVIELMDSGV